MPQVTFAEVKNNEAVCTYIRRADEALTTMGYTEHAFAHVTKCAEGAYEILNTLGYEPRLCELARIAGFMHDIGNVINRQDHAQSGAIMAFRILDQMGMSADEVALVIAAIGNHDEGTAVPVSPIAAALILADKCDVRRSRVRNRDATTFDIHDRVNYAVEAANLSFSDGKEALILDITIDPEICPVMNYFEIFLNRMLLCRRAADFLGLKFKLVVNGLDML